MNLSDLQLIFTFIGGVGLFLYGMHMMSEGLQQVAGEKTKKLMGYLTNNRFLAIIVGAGVTAIIQSSSATTVLVVGLVNATVLNLTQAVGVIMGANIGTTMTAWLVSMSEWGAIFQPDFFAPLFVGIGAFLILFISNEKKKEVGKILVGFGVLFMGLSAMSSAIEPYSDSEIFYNIFRVIGSNPLLGIAVGAIVTALIQSSSASLGILQTLAINGMVNWQSAVFIALGQNVGTCVTAILSSVKTNANARRAALVHLLFNVIGVVVFGAIMFVVFAINKQLIYLPINSVELAMFHSIFNIANTIILFPFMNLLVKMAMKLIPDEKKKSLLVHLDQRMLEAPAIALGMVETEINNMGELALQNVLSATKAIIDDNSEETNKVFEREQTINQYEKELTAYLAQFNMVALTDQQQQLVKDLLYTASNLERVSDHCENLAELARDLQQQNLKFSIGAYDDLTAICSQTYTSISNAVKARKDLDITSISNVRESENKVDDLEKELRDKHIHRLSQKLCRVETGVIFLDIISNLERISDHAMNIADYVCDELGVNSKERIAIEGKE